MPAAVNQVAAMQDLAPRTMWKFSLCLTAVQTIPMPASAEVLSVGNQFEAICLWARVDPTAAMVPRTFAIVGTGHPTPAHHDGRFIGTVPMRDGALIWHIFECIGGSNAS